MNIKKVNKKEVKKLKAVNCITFSNCAHVEMGEMLLRKIPQ